MSLLLALTGGGPATRTFDLAATEAPDVAALSFTLGHPFDLAATESPDVAAFSFTVSGGAATRTFDIAASEAPDAAAFSFSSPTGSTGSGGGSWSSALYIMYGDDERKATRKKRKSAELALARVIGENWDRTLAEVEATVRAELQRHKLAVDAHNEARLAAYVKAAHEVERQKRAKAQADAIDAAMKVQAAMTEQTRQQRNKLLIALLMAADS